MTVYYLGVLIENISICLDTDVHYHYHFSPGDTIKLNKRRGLTQVIEVRVGKWMPEYVVLIDGVETVIGQSDIIPL